MEKLTEHEEKAMLAVWQNGPGFIKDFLDHIPRPKPVYTTFASTIKNLEKKGYLKSEKMGPAIRYSAKVKEAEYKKRFMTGVVNDFFQSSYKDVVTYFAKEKKVSVEELKEVIKLIENPEN
ncbi:MAG: BlaI/MecI/CopY family transcriptional regulator [Chitinophagaceae bacterium]